MPLPMKRRRSSRASSAAAAWRASSRAMARFWVICSCWAWIDCLACRASNWLVAWAACSAPPAAWLCWTRSASALSSWARFCVTCACTRMAVCSPSRPCCQRSRASWARRWLLTLLVYSAGYRRANCWSRRCTS
ncbi:hypothetical protein D3C84_970650 [compost metagenome]